MEHINLAVLGALGLIQGNFLPGYLLLRTMRIGSGIIGTAVVSFGLSLLVNYLLVAGLVVAGIYRPAVMYAVFAAEAALWLRLDYRALQTPLDRTLAAVRRRMQAFVWDIEHHSPIRARWLRLAMLAAAAMVIGGFALAGIAEVGRIFHQWDAVVSWNRWAVDWAGNRLPRVTSLYPQLLPANISLSYVFMQTSEVWIFAKAAQFLFCLMLLLAMFDASRHMGNFGLVPGVVVTYGLLVALLRYRMLSSGYADVPLAFFVWMPVYALEMAGHAADGRQRMKWLILGALFAAAAALTKQLGLYVAALYPLLACVWPASGMKKMFFLGRHFLRLCFLIGVLVAPWYLYKLADIRAGHDEDNTPKLVQASHEGRELPERLLHAGAAVAEATTWPGAVLLVLAVAASLGDPRSRWLLGMFVMPLGLLWSAAFSYDLRNLAMLVPFVGMAAGLGLARIVCWTEGRENGRQGEREKGRRLHVESPLLSFSPAAVPSPRSRVAAIPVGALVATLTLAAIAAALCVSNETLLASQRQQQRRSGIVPLNERLYAFAAAHPDFGRIASDYQAMRWLPELAPQTVVCSCRGLAVFRQAFDRDDVRYVLVRTDSAAAEVLAFLARPSAARLLFEDHGFAFYEKLIPSA